MHYKIIYKTKSEKEKTIVSIYSEIEIIDITKQLQRGIASIKGKLINGLCDLDHIEIIKCNYDYIDKKGFHIEERLINNNGEIIDVPEYSIILNPDFIPEEVDVTNKLLYDLNIGHIGDKIFNYKNGVITIYGEVYPLNKRTKYWEVFDLILETYNRSKENSFDYEKLNIIFNEKKYSEISSKDLVYTPIRNTLKDKIKEIREYFKMKKDIISLSKTSIIINNI